MIYIMRENKLTCWRVWRGIVFGSNFNGWSVTGLRHIQPEVWREVNKIMQETRLRYMQRGLVQLLPLKVFYIPDSIANILALADFTSQLRATMDTNN